MKTSHSEGRSSKCQTDQKEWFLDGNEKDHVMGSVSLFFWGKKKGMELEDNSILRKWKCSR